MKRKTTVPETDAGIERLLHLEEQLARAPVNSRRHHALRAGIRIETDAYRKSLDIEQAAATHDGKRSLTVGRGFLNRIAASRTPSRVPRHRTHSRSR